MSSGLPPDTATAVLTVQGSSIISAPIDVVWNHLLDFPSYSEWNPFVRGQTILDSTSQRLSGTGQRMHIFPVHLPPTFGDPGITGKSATFVVCSMFDPDNHRVGWVTDGWMPKWLLFANRWQTLTQLEDGTVKYESVESFHGLLAHLVKLFVEKNLILGVDAMAAGLKTRSEQSS